MSRRLLVDTDIVIDFLRGREQAVAHFRAYSDSISFSAITEAEIYSGIRNSGEEADVSRLFSVFPVIAVTSEIARDAGKLVQKYRASHSVEIPDAIIAATCIISDSELHTLNVKHYPMFRSLKPPYLRR